MHFSEDIFRNLQMNELKLQKTTPISSIYLVQKTKFVILKAFIFE